MIREKIKWADPLTQAMMLLILGLILFFIFKKMTAAFSMFALSAIRGFYMLKHEKGLIIENDYPGIFYVKPENSDEPIKVTPHTSLPIPADGIKIKDKVFKLRTGTNVKITKEGQVITYSPISALVNGYVQLKDFNKQERESWKKLFKISN
ncbi:MAG: hypothetical protein N2203_06075 [Bacteroidia bacterium]|nr:hypothetical protein [Bacteroidia bacterium]